MFAARRAGSNTEPRPTLTPRPTHTPIPTSTPTLPPEGVAVELSRDARVNATDFWLRRFIIPQPWQPPADVPPRYLVLVDITPESATDCNLRRTDTSQARLRANVHISISDTLSGEIIAEQAVAGAAPSCPFFPIDTLRRPLVSEVRSFADAETWMLETLNQLPELEALNIEQLPREGVVFSISGSRSGNRYSSVLSDEQQATDNVLPRYELIMHLNQDTIENCEYVRDNEREPSIILLRNRFILTARLIDLASNEEVAQHDFEGSMPEMCPDGIQDSSGTSTTLDIRINEGNMPTATVVTEWLTIVLLQEQANIDNDTVRVGSIISPTDNRDAQRYIGSIPSRWIVPDERVPRYEITVEYLTIDEQCFSDFYDGYILRQRYELQITITDFEIDEIVAEDNIAGSIPPRCPTNSEFGQLFSANFELKGDAPSAREFVDSINTIMRELPNATLEDVEDDE